MMDELNRLRFMNNAGDFAMLCAVLFRVMEKVENILSLETFTENLKVEFDDTLTTMESRKGSVSGIV